LIEVTVNAAARYETQHAVDWPRRAGTGVQSEDRVLLLNVRQTSREWLDRAGPKCLRAAVNAIARSVFGTLIADDQHGVEDKRTPERAAEQDQRADLEMLQ
jgi:hypothetical protein